MDLTIVIPCKNEERYIGKLLESISRQFGIRGVDIIIADAKSTDSTISVINSFDKLNIKIVEGGSPAVGRNIGSSLVSTSYVLFIDADVEIYKSDLIKSAYDMMCHGRLDLVTSKLNSKILPVKILYTLTNWIINLSKFDRPFSTGSFMMMSMSSFRYNGGFQEDLLHCEDYFLSKKIEPHKFGVVDGFIWTDNRRFKKMGYWGMVKYMIKNIYKRNNESYFKKDIGYWSEN